jgi:large subunit ribosomal protein L31
MPGERRLGTGRDPEAISWTADEETYMKTATHPDYVTASVRCSCGNTFTTRSVRPELRVELCNECHPFFTGKQKLVDTGGRVERFERRYGARKGQTKK